MMQTAESLRKQLSAVERKGSELTAAAVKELREKCSQLEVLLLSSQATLLCSPCGMYACL